MSLPRLRFAMLVALMGVSFAGCGDDSGGPTDPEPSGGADVDSYLAGLPGWESFSPPLPDNEGASGEKATENETVEGVTYECVSTPYSITRTPEKIVTLNPDSEILWPGVLLQGHGYAGVGSLLELPIRERAPLTISIDLLSENNTRTVADPDLASVTQAIGSLIEGAQLAGHTAGSNVLYTQERMHSVDQGLLKMGLSAKYTGVEVEGSLEVELTAERTNVTAYFVQRMFTVSVVLPSTPGAFFSDAFTNERLQEQIDLDRLGPDNPPVFLSNVVYGRMLVFSFSSSASETDIRSTLNVVLESGGKGGSEELTKEMETILTEAEIKVVTVGGDASHALALIRSGDLGEFFESDAPLTTARPISYTVRNLADNSIAKVSETTEYNLRQCAPEGATGALYKVTLNQLTFTDTHLCLGFPSCPAIRSYVFWVDDDYEGPVKLAEWEAGALGSSMCRGETWDLRGRPPLAPTVKLHFNGGDVVKLYGYVQYNSLGSPSQLWEWNERWEARRLPTGTVDFITWGPGGGYDCYRGRLRGQITKVDDVYD